MTGLRQALTVLAVVLSALAWGKSTNAAAQDTASQKPPATAPADKAKAAIAEIRKITATRGIQELIEIPVGGTKQWISVRGRDRANPILLVIHGGPAAPEMPASWFYQTPWEEFFTVVQWDQRGAGKTYRANDPAVIAPTLSLDRIVDDAAEVITYLRKTYGKDKVFVLGHSWGSVVGISLARKHPELLYAYVGMGQVINGHDNERIGYQMTLQAAEAANNVQAVKELKAIAPYPAPDGTVALEKLGTERKWSIFFGGLTWGRSSFDYVEMLEKLSPEYSDDDFAAIDKGSALSLAPLFSTVINFDFKNVTSFDCPIVMFEGRHDATTPSPVVGDWFARVNAPAKKFIWFENSAHMIELEEPGQVLLHLVNDVRPLAQ